MFRLGEALSDSEIEKNENVGASRRNSSGTGDPNHLGRKSHKSRIVVRRRHNSSSSDGSILQNSTFITPVIGESRNITNQCKTFFNSNIMCNHNLNIIPLITHYINFTYLFLLQASLSNRQGMPP